MYKLIARLKENDKIRGYRIKDLLTGVVADLSIDDFRKQVAMGNVLGLHITNGRIYGALQNIPAVSLNFAPTVSANPHNSISLYTDTKFDILCTSLLKGITQHISLYDKCLKSVTDNSRNVLILSGIRRMGKTVLSLQLLRYLKSTGAKVAYMTLRREVTMDDVCAVLDTLNDYNYICIDEVSRCGKFVDECSILYDGYSFIGHRIILTGTDSFVFPLAIADSLFGRAYIYNLTILPYVDFKRLKKGTFEDYMKTSSLIDSQISFDIRLSFSYNIFNSLQRSDLKRTLYSYDILGQMSPELLHWYVLNALTRLVSYWNSKYETIKEGIIKGASNKVTIRHRAMSTLFDTLLQQYKLKNFTSTFNAQEFNLVRQALVDLGAISDIHFYNKRGYATVHDKIDAVCQHKEPNGIIESMYCVNVFGMYSTLVDKFREVLEGECLAQNCTMESGNFIGELYENIIRVNLLYYSGNNLTIGFYRADSGEEVDIVVYDRRTNYIDLYEVKHSSKQDSKFLRHMYNTSVVKDIEDFVCVAVPVSSTKVKVRNRYVLYSGETKESYINIEEFLLKLPKLYGD